MAEEQTDYSQMYDFLYRIDRRVGYLERDAAFIEKQIMTLEGKRTKEFESLKGHLTAVRESLSVIKQHFNACSHAMTLLSKELRDTAKKEEVNGMGAALEEIKFEEYVTHRDLKRGL